ncbi:MAG: dTMP kinase [Lachnospiraceae bacterium]|nr:dTMP kinase [Lachnospiraceae bacterium]
MNEEQKTAQNHRGKLIAFEGIDGSGKSTQIRLLAERLKREGISCQVTMEPTGSPIGSLIRQILTGRLKADNRVMAALFVADRLDHLINEDNGIVPVIESGTHVITDRYYFSSYAYQSSDLPLDWLIQANEPGRKILCPALTEFMDVAPDSAMDRITRGREHTELFEKRSRLEQVREKYLEAFEKLKDVERVIMIDGSRCEEAVAEEIWEKLAGIWK